MTDRPSYEDLEKRVSKLEGKAHELEKSKRELCENRDFFQSIVDTIPDFLYIYDVSENRIVYANRGVSAVLGYTADEFQQLGDSALRVLIHPDDLPRVEKVVTSLRQGEDNRNVTAEYRIKHKNGHWVTIRDSATVFKRTPDSDSCQILGYATDISRSEQAQDRLQDKEIKFKQLFDEMKDGVAVYEVMDGGKDFVFRDINVSGEKIGNVEKSKVIGKSLYEIRPNIEEFGLTDALREVWRTGEAKHHADRFYEDEGLKGWFDNYLYKLDANHVVAIFADNTAHRQAIAALEESEERFSLAMRFSNDGLYDWNLKNDSIYFSPGWRRLLGYEDDEIKNEFSEWERFTRPQDVKESWAMLKRVIDGSLERFEIEFKMLHKEGHWIDILSRANVVRDESGEAVRVVGTHVDITDIIRLEKQQQQAQKMEAIGTLAGGIAHDFNNLLGVMSGNVSLLINRYSQDEALIEVLSDIQHGTQNSQKLTQQLLTFAGGGAPIKKESDINRLVRESAEFSTRGAKTKCEFCLSDDLWSAFVDSGQLNQVFGNLVINANQAMPNGGVITVGTQNINGETEPDLLLPEVKYIKVSFRDRGVGIAQEHLPNIFDPYFTTKQTGSGLGLATSYSIIKRHEGHISVESTLGEGTTFHIYLPSSGETARQAEAKIRVAHKGHGSVLVMDDDE